MNGSGHANVCRAMRHVHTCGRQEQDLQLWVQRHCFNFRRRGQHPGQLVAAIEHAVGRALMIALLLIGCYQGGLQTQ